MRFLVVALFVGLSVLACEAGGDGPPGGASCASSTDCPTSMVCAFPVPGGCSGGAIGQCGTPPPTSCASEPVCSCAGVTTSVCVVAGYTWTTPASALGACAGDGGLVDAAADAAGDAPQGAD
jgi:hypothetical protein